MSLAKKVYTSPLFARKAKKLSKREKQKLDDEIKKIFANPTIGDEKKGDLKGVRVHKFKMNKVQILLAYRKSPKELLLLTFGSHENYYRDLKNYLNY